MKFALSNMQLDKNLKNQEKKDCSARLKEYEKNNILDFNRGFAHNILL